MPSKDPNQRRVSTAPVGVGRSRGSVAVGGRRDTTVGRRVSVMPPRPDSPTEPNALTISGEMKPRSGRRVSVMPPQQEPSSATDGQPRPTSPGHRKSVAMRMARVALLVPRRGPVAVRDGSSQSPPRSQSPPKPRAQQKRVSVVAIGDSIDTMRVGGNTGQPPPPPSALIGADTSPRRTSIMPARNARRGSTITPRRGSVVSPTGGRPPSPPNNTPLSNFGGASSQQPFPPPPPGMQHAGAYTANRPTLIEVNAEFNRCYNSPASNASPVGIRPSHLEQTPWVPKRERATTERRDTITPRSRVHRGSVGLGGGDRSLLPQQDQPSGTSDRSSPLPRPARPDPPPDPSFWVGESFTGRYTLDFRLNESTIRQRTRLLTLYFTSELIASIAFEVSFVTRWLLHVLLVKKLGVGTMPPNPTFVELFQERNASCSLSASALPNTEAIILGFSSLAPPPHSYIGHKGSPSMVKAAARASALNDGQRAIARADSSGIATACTTLSEEGAAAQKVLQDTREEAFGHVDIPLRPLKACLRVVTGARMQLLTATA